jgi:hypothetical protein
MILMDKKYVCKYNSYWKEIDSPEQKGITFFTPAIRS